MEQKDILKKLAELKPHLKAEGVEHLAIFGSRARGDNRFDSDIDILVDVEPNRNFSILNLVGVEHIVNDATGLTTNALMRRSLKDGLKATAERDAIEVF